MTASAEIELRQGLYKALSHPLRREILDWLIDRSAGSPSEMSRDLAADLTEISYHARQLEKYGAIELVEERPTRRGSPEHIYRPIVRLILSDAEVETMARTDRQIFAGQIVQRMMADLRKGFQVGAFGKRFDWELLHHVLTLDKEGYQRVRDLYQRVEEELFQIQAESDERRIGSKEPALRVSTAQSSFIVNA
ncbi:MAG TPA: helix-turn-helix domain-containing protein [Solirubrobacterales bacterium]|nr:helix-turn-helix domain-containing protein [Solirubrobacterales bacterium]